MTATYDLSINNGLVWVDGTLLAANLGTLNGRIAAVIVRNPESAPLTARETVDAQGLLVLPGFIDPHVHFALGVGSTRSIDDFHSGSRAAAWGGVTTFIDFLDPIKQADQLQSAFDQRQQLAAGSWLDYAFHATIANPVDPADQIIDAARSLGIPSIKLFTTYSSTDRRTPDRYIAALLAVSATNSCTVLVHAENEGLIDPRPGIPVAEHERSRPALCEITEILKLAELTRVTGGRLYVVHTTCGSSLQRLSELYPELLGKRLFIESCPHYFRFDASEYHGPEGGLFTMTPPLRSREEREALIARIHAVQCIGTDHCSYNQAAKQADTTDHIPMGVGGIEFSFAALYDQFGPQIIDRFTTNPAQIHGLWPRKGNLLPGADADIVLFDPNQEWMVSDQHGQADYSIYEGMPLRGQVRSTISAGQFLVRDRTWVGPARGSGRYLPRLSPQ